MALPPGCFMTNAGSKGCRPYVWEATNVTSFFCIPLNIDVGIQFNLNCHHLVKNACTWWPQIIHSSMQPVKIRICSTNQKPVAAYVFFFRVCKGWKKVKNTMKRQFDGVVLKLISCYWRIKSVPSPDIDHWPSTNHSDYKSAWRE